MNRTHVLLAAVIGAVAVGCKDLPADESGGGGGGIDPGGTSSGAGGDQTGEVSFLTTAPAGAQCIRIVATPATGAALTKTFTVTGGGSTSTLSLGVLPTGTVGFSGDAFTVACTALTSATPSWTADPTSATIKAGVVTSLTMTFRPRNAVNVSVNFVKNITAVVASGQTSAALSDGPPEIWGEATGGWITPTVFTPPADAIAFSAGLAHACIVRKDGTVWCWGQSPNGQLGPGVPIGSGNLNAVQVPLPGPASLVSAGANFTCAYVTSPSQVWCWGANENFQIGSPTLSQSATPVAVANTSYPIVRVLSAGMYHVIATTSDGRYFAWGRNADGEFGDGSNFSSPTSFLESTDSAILATCAGELHTCAVHADGSVSCWGNNLYGQIGDGTFTQRNSPTKVTGLPAAATGVSCGQDHTCARLVDGRVACWGRNDQGQVGDLTTTTRTAPTLVNLGSESAQSLTSGYNHNCVFTQSQAALCWGYNGFGEIGDGTLNTAFAPLKITLQ